MTALLEIEAADPRLRGYSVGRYYDPQTGQFLSVDPLVDQTGQPYAYVNGDPVDGIDPLGLWGWNPIADAHQAWNDTGGALVSGIGKVRVPDYVSLSVTLQIPGVPIVVTGGITVTRQGHIYVTGGGGLGGGYDLNVTGAWLDQGAPAPACELDPFVSGVSTTATGDLPLWPEPALGVGPTAGETWGHPGRFSGAAAATEVGVGVGTPGVSGVVTYSHRLPANLPGW